MKKELVFEKLAVTTVFTWRNYDTVDIDVYNSNDNTHITGICFGGNDIDKIIRFLVNHHLKNANWADI